MKVEKLKYVCVINIGDNYMPTEGINQIELEYKPESTNILLLNFHSLLSMYIEFINSFATGMVDFFWATWKVLSSKEAIEVYIVIGKVLFFFLVIALTILEAFAESKNNRRGRRRDW
jgi:hypothetical protein